MVINSIRGGGHALHSWTPEGVTGRRRRRTLEAPRTEVRDDDERRGGAPRCDHDVGGAGVPWWSARPRGVPRRCGRLDPGPRREVLPAPVGRRGPAAFPCDVRVRQRGCLRGLGRPLPGGPAVPVSYTHLTLPTNRE